MRERADLARHRELWALVNERFTDAHADVQWAVPGIRWGLFRRPEAELGLLGDVAGSDVVEHGCGAAFLSASLARAGVDVSCEQLDTARRCQQRHGLCFPLVEADAVQVPLHSCQVDLVVSEYGAAPSSAGDSVRRSTLATRGDRTFLATFSSARPRLTASSSTWTRSVRTLRARAADPTSTIFEIMDATCSGRRRLTGTLPMYSHTRRICLSYVDHVVTRTRWRAIVSSHQRERSATVDPAWKPSASGPHRASRAASARY